MGIGPYLCEKYSMLKLWQAISNLRGESSPQSFGLRGFSYVIAPQLSDGTWEGYPHDPSREGYIQGYDLCRAEGARYVCVKASGEWRGDTEWI